MDGYYFVLDWPTGLQTEADPTTRSDPSLPTEGFDTKASIRTRSDLPIGQLGILIAMRCGQVMVTTQPLGTGADQATLRPDWCPPYIRNLKSTAAKRRKAHGR